MVRWLRIQWDRVLAVTLVVAGVVALVVGWVGISGELYTVRQLPYLVSGGLGGLFLLGLGIGLWLSADIRDEWHQLRRIEARMVEGDPGPVPPKIAAAADRAVGAR